MRFLRVLNIGLVGLSWTALTILLTIVGALFLVAVWQAVDPDERLRRLYESRDFQRIEKMARQGDTAAEYWMGVIEQQRGQSDQAKEWYLRAAARQDDRAIRGLAALYRTENDLAESARWLRRGAELGDLWMQFELAKSYRHGLGVPRDDREAFRWFHAVAKKGDGDSSLVVGGMYARGEGTERDPVEAMAWVTIAQNQQIESDGQPAVGTGCALRDELVAELSPQQVERAIRRAHELHPGVMRAATGRDTCKPRRNKH